MTQAKKSPARKKTSKSVSTRKGKQAKAAPLTWKFYAVTIGIFAISVATVIVIALFAANIIQRAETSQRLGRINEIYSSLQLDDTYQVESSDIFGKKKPYEWDASRSHSSVVTYSHGESVSTTFNELDGKIRAAGFTFVSEPYPGAVQKQYHYKSSDGEYIRLSVESKKYSDAIRNAALMKEDIGPVVDEAGKDIESGPAKVTIKVNLDDNNE